MQAIQFRFGKKKKFKGKPSNYKATFQIVRQSSACSAKGKF